MKHLLRLLVPASLILLFCRPLVAQDENKDYPNFQLLSDAEQAAYDSSPKKILPDARAAFKAAKYDRAIALCNYHYIYYGDKIGSIPGGADELKEKDELDSKAKRCYDLTTEINALVQSGNLATAREKAWDLLELNLGDAHAKEIINNSASSSVASSGTSTSSQQVASQPTASQITTSQPASSGNMINGHEYVDLGLSVKWATCNVGASSPSDYGSYFAWGETSTKSEDTWENYRFRKNGDSAFNFTFWKYNTKSVSGVIDNKTTLELSDDAARSNWGGSWRMPTKLEQEELRDKCTWTWTVQNGINGYKVTSKNNGKSIFLPAADDRYGRSIFYIGSRGRYWSSSLSTGYSGYAFYLSFDSSSVNSDFGGRATGRPVRPVTD